MSILLLLIISLALIAGVVLIGCGIIGNSQAAKAPATVSKPLLIIASGVSLIYIPLVILNLLQFADVETSTGIWNLRGILAIVGAVMSVAGATVIGLRTTGNARKGSLLIAYGNCIFTLALIIVRLNAYSDSLLAFFVSDEYGSAFLFILVELLSIIYVLSCLVASVIFVPVFKKAKLMTVGYGIMFVMSIFYILTLKGSYDFTIFFICSSIGAILAIIGWWLTAVYAKAAEQAGLTVVDNIQPSTTQAPGNLPCETSSKPNQRPENRLRAQKSDVDESLKNQLMGQTDEQLRQIVDNPSLYSNPDYVAEARRILNKRAAWVIINEKPDEELLEIAIDAQKIYTDDMRDAASMELYSRDSKLLRDILTNADNDILDDILENPGNYYDGYILMARKIAGGINPDN